MALYVCTQSVYPNSSTYKHLHKLYLTNDPASYFPDNASSFVEYEPNMSSFPSFDGLDVVRNNVISVGFNNDELTIKLPEDCSGLFRNLHLGQPDMNSNGWY